MKNLVNGILTLALTTSLGCGDHIRSSSNIKKQISTACTLSGVAMVVAGVGTMGACVLSGGLACLAGAAAFAVETRDTIENCGLEETTTLNNLDLAISQNPKNVQEGTKALWSKELTKWADEGDFKACRNTPWTAHSFAYKDISQKYQVLAFGSPNCTGKKIFDSTKFGKHIKGHNKKHNTKLVTLYHTKINSYRIIVKNGLTSQSGEQGCSGVQNTGNNLGCMSIKLQNGKWHTKRVYKNKRMDGFWGKDVLNSKGVDFWGFDDTCHINFYYKGTGASTKFTGWYRVAELRGTRENGTRYVSWKPKNWVASRLRQRVGSNREIKPSEVSDIQIKCKYDKRF